MLKQILESLPDHQFTIIEGFNDAIIGVAEDERGLHLLYLLSKVYEIMMNEFDIDSIEDCHDWYYQNMLSLTGKVNGPMFQDDTIIMGDL